MTASVVDMAKSLQTLMEVNSGSLGLQAVYYGDQEKIPFTPTVCVESGDKTNSLQGAPRRSLVTMTSYIIVYIASVKSVQANREEDDRLAEAVETVVHADATLGETVIDSMVDSIEYGYQVRGSSLYRAARLTVTARQYNQLPSSV